MRDVVLEIPEEAAAHLRRSIEQASGNEVFFLGRVVWNDAGVVARLDEVEAFCRGDASSVPAIVAGAEDWDLAIHNHPSGGLEPSGADLAIAAELGNKGVGFAIIDNQARTHYLVVNPFRRPSRQPVDAEHVRWLLGPDGPFARKLPGFESRPGQIEMAAEVAGALNDDRVVACEAGTGVGKSFAYLVPSILWAVANRDRVIVSTGTINLQEQLVAKDLPFLREVLPVGFDFTLLKGRSNYACKRKLSELPEELSLFADQPRDQDMLGELIEWAKTSKGGSLSDLGWTPPGRVWEKAMSETDKSLKTQCRFYDECFYYQARRRASRAQVVVVNHHLFFADLAVRRQYGNWQFDAILPVYSRVVFDEAHHLEDVASEHLGSRFSRLGVRQRLGRMRSKEGQRGTYVLIARKLRSHDDPVAAEKIEGECASEVREMAVVIEDLFDEIDELVASERDAGRLDASSHERGGRIKLRYRAESRLVEFWDQAVSILHRVRGSLERVARVNDRAHDLIRDARVGEDVNRALELEVEAFGNRLQSFIAAVERFCDLDDATHVRWLDTADGATASESGAIGFASVPVSVAAELQSSLFQRVQSIVMTSATLSVAGNADFLGERVGFVGLPDERFAFREHPSPFDFARQVLLAVPTDIPDPTQSAFEDRLPDLLLRLIDASGGRAFVLFTAYGLLRRMYARLEAPVTARGLRPLAQGDAQRSEILQRFIDSRCGVLFGTDSFWEGVDVKGRALEQVIITRLPFRVPTEPLQEARLERIRERGEDPFSQFTVPQAVLRFKQGFGRLIRAQSDRGVVTVLDRRLLTKSYGRVFLKSLPPTMWCAAGTDSVVERIAEFFRVAPRGPSATRP